MGKKRQPGAPLDVGYAHKIFAKAVFPRPTFSCPISAWQGTRVPDHVAS